jgi:hypothetical protein
VAGITVGRNPPRHPTIYLDHKNVTSASFNLNECHLATVWGKAAPRDLGSTAR